MLFNSYIFIFLFLPITVIVFYLLGKYARLNAAIIWLFVASMFFYGWWNPIYLWLIVVSIVFNYVLGLFLYKLRENVNKHLAKMMLIIGVIANLSLLGYYKYANFFVENTNEYLGTDIQLAPIILPIAISFFTFQQIAYLVDAYRGETEEYNFIHYCLFVTFFPQLIAGPIVHHKEMLPQFFASKKIDLKVENIIVGLAIFSIGLFKKVVIADNIALYATPAFAAADQGVALSFIEAWGASLSYTFQLYFDFSGYADMAIGAARMFGIKLPLNFNSPYKANSIIDFWRRWHMTLSRFLRDYVYIPLGGNRNGKYRKHLNMLATMFLGGLWHGAGWTFVCWGILHGLYLVINNIWRTFVPLDPKNIYNIIVMRVVTFVAIVVGWVLFRAETIDGAMSILSGMAGLNGLIIPEKYLGPLAPYAQNIGIETTKLIYFSGFGQILFLVALFVIVWFAPNTQEIMSEYSSSTSNDSASEKKQLKINFRPTTVWAFIISILFVAGLLSLNSVSEFLYFQF